MLLAERTLGHQGNYQQSWGQQLSVIIQSSLAFIVHQAVLRWRWRSGSDQTRKAASSSSPLDVSVHRCG